MQCAGCELIGSWRRKTPAYLLLIAVQISHTPSHPRALQDDWKNSEMVEIMHPNPRTELCNGAGRGYLIWSALGFLEAGYFKVTLAYRLLWISVFKMVSVITA